MNNIDKDILNESSEFLIGSITKIITIISLLLLHQNKQINIYNNIGKYIKNNHIKNLKIIDIINHTSGLKNILDKVNTGYSKIKYESATEIYNKLYNNKLINKKIKGTFSYSNIGYIILGVLIENVSGLTYSDYIKHNIIIPLKLNNTGIEDTNVILYNNKLKKLNKYEKWIRTFVSSAGQLKSCIKDLTIFSKNFITLLDKKTLNLLNKLYIYKEENGNIIISHNGNITGGSSILKIIYDKHYKVKNIYILLKTIV